MVALAAAQILKSVAEFDVSQMSVTAAGIQR
jgi:hypothetical protein